MGLQIKMWLLVSLMFGLLYAVITGVGSYLGVGNALFYVVLAGFFMGIQYLVGPALVAAIMRVRWVSEKEEPELHIMVAELAQRASIPKPRLGISRISIPNAFAFGRSLKDGRVCVTEGITRLLSKEELKAVLGHEIAHLKHRDMVVITVLSVVPLIFYWLAWSLMWGGMAGGRRREGGGYAALIGLAAFALYFLTNLLVLYGSRIREYYADERSVKIGNPPHYLASALYKLVYSSAQLRRSHRAKEELQRVQAVRAFFLNDVARASTEIQDLKEVDTNLSGTIDQNELLALRSKRIKLKGVEHIMEVFTTHPNMLKRIKRLASLV
ncbi:M48 family metalloprotease [Candidatus Aerophobetes bacterium]|nr:M48 family metalloprotease [Candidatus Aerophobetes bacterium]